MKRRVQQTSLTQVIFIGAFATVGCVTFDQAPYEVAPGPSAPVDPGESAPSTMLRDPTPVEDASACPIFCQGGCAANECLIDCALLDCDNTLFICPAGINCHLLCANAASCSAATLRCEEDNECSVTCTGKESCEELLFVCNGDSCNLQCEATKSCDDATLNCPNCSPEEDD